MSAMESPGDGGCRAVIGELGLARVAGFVDFAVEDASRRESVWRRDGELMRRLRSVRGVVEVGVEMPDPEATGQLLIEAHNP